MVFCLIMGAIFTPSPART
uniref:Uncharacterized protein n=1 Tax=Arundo donax TaxID=35708 RepID=A0A0A9BQ83_ARUDO